MSVCELSAGGEKDFNARLMFCTYQTMINYIDAEDKRFSAGRFDLIIIDEAHRSIFNRYGTIFKYFDSFLVCLTATPKNEVDANTYRIFGCEAGIPNFDYTLEDAVKEKYLVGYHVINRTSKMLSKGIDYDDLTEDEKEQLDEYLEEDPPTPDFNIPGNEIFKDLCNKDTCRRVLEELMQWGSFSYTHLVREDYLGSKRGTPKTGQPRQSSICRDVWHLSLQPDGMGNR